MKASQILAFAAYPGIWAVLYFPAAWIGGRADWVADWCYCAHLAAAVVWGGLMNAAAGA